jgi:CheY-like chemotaxis protein
MHPGRTAPLILVVEDDPDIRETLKQVLEFQGYQVAQASHGREAMDWLKGGGRPSLILLDLMMPIMNGWEFLEQGKAEGQLGRVPVIVISAVSQFTPMEKIRDYPVLRKPLDLDLLIATIEKQLAAERS